MKFKEFLKGPCFLAFMFMVVLPLIGLSTMMFLSIIQNEPNFDIVEKEKVEILKIRSEEDKLGVASHEQMLDIVQWTWVYRDRKNYEITNKISYALCGNKITKEAYYEIKELVDNTPVSSYQLQDIKEWNKKYPEMNRVINAATKDGKVTSSEYWEILYRINRLKNLNITKEN